MQEAKELPEKVKQSDEQLEELKTKVEYYMMRLPNILHDSVPTEKTQKTTKLSRLTEKSLSLTLS